MTGLKNHVPTFLIIGAQKCATNSLYQYLKQHPQIFVPHIKELHYFDREANYPDHQWYQNCFRNAQDNQVTGEGTPIYCFWPGAIDRIHDYNPAIKLIMIVRNPVERAISQYWMEYQRGDEHLPIEPAFKTEDKRHDYNHRNHSYLARGRYYQQIARINRYFSRQQLLIVRTEDLRQSPSSVLNQITDFIGVPPLELTSFPHHLVGTYPETNPQLKQWLYQYFDAHNRILSSKCGVRTDDWQVTSSS